MSLKPSMRLPECRFFRHFDISADPDIHMASNLDPEHTYFCVYSTLYIEIACFMNANS